MLIDAEPIELLLLNVVSTALVEVGNRRPVVEFITGLFDPETVLIGAKLLTMDAIEVDVEAC